MNAGLRLHAAWRFSPSAIIGGAGLLTVVLAAAGAPLLTSYDPLVQDPAARLLSPSLTHLLGTDDFGRDIFTRILYGGRSALLVGGVSVSLALAAGTAAGLLAGYRGGHTSTAIMRVTDAMLAIPLVLMAVIIVVALGPGLVNVTLAVTFSQVPIFTRLARSLTLSVLTNEFVEAARSLGAADWRIIRAHLLPNIAGPLIVQSTATVALAILNSTALNFLGLGLQPPTPDWGAMVSDFRRFVFDRPLLPLYPGLAIAMTVLSLNLLGDGLARLIDPTQRNRLR